MAKSAVMFKRKLVGVAFCALLCAFATFLFYSVREKSEVTIITYDGTNFTPASITVPLGTTVTFKNKSTEAFWPASNLHPSHSIYSEFDPKKPIASGDSWSFTFTKPGEWEYHDHIRSTHQGIVSVLNADGTVVPPVDCSLQENNQKCWEKEILTSLKEGGVDGAFEAFTGLYDSSPEFANGCHSFTHLIGKSSYEQFVNKESFSLTPKMQYCGYGFFHGFMEELLNQSGDIRLAREFCAYVDTKLSSSTPAALNACYHGIGHGAVDGGDPRAWGNAYGLIKPALDLCVKVGDTEFEKHLCGTGVFNGIAIAMTNGSYGLHVTKEHVFDLCESLDLELFKRGCYDQMNTLIFHLADADMRSAFDIIGTMKERAYYQNALNSLMSIFVHANMSVKEYDDAIVVCNERQQPDRGTCIMGLVTGLVEFGPHGKEYAPGIDFCRSNGLDDASRSECFESLVMNASFIFGEEDIGIICSKIEKDTDIKAIPQCS